MDASVSEKHGCCHWAHRHFEASLFALSLFTGNKMASNTQTPYVMSTVACTWPCAMKGSIYGIIPLTKEDCVNPVKMRMGPILALSSRTDRRECCWRERPRAKGDHETDSALRSSLMVDMSPVMGRAGIVQCGGSFAFQQQQKLSSHRYITRVEITGVFFFSDFPHFVKCVRNGFINRGYKTPEGHADIKPIQVAHKHDQCATTLKAMLKITTVHRQPNDIEKNKSKLHLPPFQCRGFTWPFFLQEANRKTLRSRRSNCEVC